MKKMLFTFLPIFLCIAVLLSACGAPAAKPEEPKPEGKAAETQEFTDSLGRTVTLPANIKKVAVSGPLAQTYLVPLCADLFAGFSIDYAPESLKYFPKELWELPHLGQLYGGKGTMDLEALLKAAPDVVIDIGEQKKDMAKDFDDLSAQTGIPFIHIDATVETAGEAYKILGELLGKQEQAEKLALVERERHLAQHGLARVTAGDVVECEGHGVSRTSCARRAAATRETPGCHTRR